ncbi:MAG TPA: SURF1 family protein [Rickettsia endosymbiont of Degeeriella rufa]|nr:SURF1 family protein [Rickettsia endosymbiont of Columbicola hoogstraali]HJD62540.1 SURF1 family protein [Rickettsia endosymbiont of Degeeriella rufa]
MKTKLTVLITFIILISLGFWQLNRLKEKKLFLASMQENLTSSAIDLAEIHDNLPYHKVKITGHFLPDKDVYLYGRRSMSSEKDGYYLVTPFKTNDNKVILVARGWFSNRNKNIITQATNDEPHELISVTMPSEKTRSYLPANDIKNNVWLTLDLQEASKVLGLNLENFYLIEESKDISNLDILLPLSINHLAAIRNDHLEYAFTWFGLAASLVVIYRIYRRSVSS